MVNNFVVDFIRVLVWILIVAIFARVVLTWFPAVGAHNNPIVAVIYQITEPILAPLRRLNLRFGAFDLTPTVALIILIVIDQVVQRQWG